MPSFRIRAIEKLLSRTPNYVNIEDTKTSNYFKINVFDQIKMQQYLSPNVYKSVIGSIKNGVRIDRRVADSVSSGMKSWAIELGATHYTHWFHPLSGSTAEKHDAFFNTVDNSRSIERFDGSNLVQQEPDASSFPSGGLRNTFEARGYTAWDPSSPAFVVGHTLCIPTIFVSYTGEALDYKAPLLKSVTALNKAAVDVCHYFDRDVEKVIPSLGIEQEYFLIDEALFQARPDLILSGRTLMGHASAKDQQLEDHYFGSIPVRVEEFMRDFEIEAFKLGIPLKTRHNEVAPNQFECAPVYEDVNLAIDHNQLLMDVMNKVALRHKFKILFHEKPFKGINGSGKHNNWSLLTNTGINLLSPGKTPRTNLRFLSFLVNTVVAVKNYSEILRASIVSLGNEERLGGDEAPPSIMSVFLGKQITEMLNDIVERVPVEKMTPDEKTKIKLEVGEIPEILLDNTDRNRTSPFAFTGNRFEFRAVGSAANCASPIMVLNTAVANQLTRFKKDVDMLINNNIKKDEAIFKILKKYIIESKQIHFEGNGYSNNWVKEAEKRGLTNISSAVEALEAFIAPKTIKLFNDINILTERELKARYDIKLDIYTKKLQIESRVFGDLAINHIIPTAIKYQNTLIKNVKGLKDILDEEEFENSSKTLIQTIKKISEHIEFIRVNVVKMINERKKSNKIEDIKDKATAYSKNVKPYLEKIRTHIDKLEMIVDNELWPLPKYRELLFNN